MNSFSFSSSSSCSSRRYSYNLIIVLLLQFISFSYSADPLSFHDLVVIQPSKDAVIRLRGYDLDSNQLSYSITQIPSTGKLFQLSQVYSDYGYEPKDGTIITSTPVTVTGSRNRVYYRRPTPDVETNNKWGTFSYVVNDGKTNSYAGTITLVPPSGALVGSNFLLSNEGWSIIGNKAASTPTKQEPYSRGRLLNQYILGTEDKINVMSQTSEDNSLWFFTAPPSFLGNQGIAYGGTLQFTLGSFSGDFNSLNSHAPLVRLTCSDCQGPIYKGITLILPLSTALQSTSFSRDGTTFSFNLHETGGWLKDPQNSLKKWTTPTKCDIIQVLSRLSSLDILGDWTTWYETMALDNIQILNTKSGQIPVCAMSRPDASICTCDPLPG